MMKRFLATGVLSAAVAAGLNLLAPVSPANGADAPASTQPAAVAAQIPVKQVVLFSSGVGYFEHYGSVTGNASTELRFKTQQINDILKSLVLQDLDKGRIEAITYPSSDPIAKTLRSFQVDITANPSLGELLNQLRGARVKLSAGGESAEGTILGLEQKQKPAGDKGTVQVWMLNLINGATIRAIELDTIQKIDLLDPQLQDELTKALAALSQARDQDKKPVTIHFGGAGERRVRIGYVVETPVWKTSYRLLLDPPAAPPAAKDGKPEAPPKDPKPGQPAAAGEGGGRLQGWAIIENQTDNDWEDVQLSLVSGRPISFIQDLYQPLYVPRPVVQPELYASLRPQTYEGGLEARKQARQFAERADDRQENQTLARAPAAKAAAAAPGAEQAGASSFYRKRLADEKMQSRNELESLGAIDAAASVESIASASKVGDLFQYTVGSVTLPRQKSAMIPVVTDPVQARRLSIYNPNVLARNPLLGVRMTNTTGKHLLAGPVTVLDGGGYAGDARIEDLPPGQGRLLSYGIDQQVLVNSTAARQDSSLQTGKIVKGVLYLTYKDTASREYVAENKGDRDKTLVIEHPRRQGWTLSEPKKPDEATDVLYRFEGKLQVGAASKLIVKEEQVRSEGMAILPVDLDSLQVYSRSGPIPQPVRDALAKAGKMKGALADTQRQIADRQHEVQQITTEQTRIRENMKTVSQSTDYYGRLLKKLDEQESKIEKLQGEVQALQKTADQQRKELEDYLSTLTIDDHAADTK